MEREIRDLGRDERQLHISGPGFTVRARRERGVLSAGVRVTHGRSLSPAAARELAAAVLDAAHWAEGND